MRPYLPDLRLTGATILRDGELQRRSIGISEGLIARGPFAEVDCTGYLVLPGIVDLHGDAFERHTAPRASAPFPAAAGLRATDRDAAANGVTTAFLAQGWSWEGGQRTPEAALTVMAALDAYRPEALVDLRLQLRCETHTPDTAGQLLQAVRRHRVGYVVFNNHLDEAAEVAEADPARSAMWASKVGLSGEAYRARIAEAQRKAAAVPDYLVRLAESFDRLGVHYGSHDDRDAGARRHFAALGARICEFPTTREAAECAWSLGSPVLLGAPNVVRGGSQAGNVAAVELIRAGLCDALVSDYHYPTLAAAAFALARAGELTLPQAWRLVSETPASVLGLADRGRLAPGRRADLVLVSEATLEIEATISAGRIAWLSGEAARRFVSAGTGAPRALPVSGISRQTPRREAS